MRADDLLLAALLVGCTTTGGSDAPRERAALPTVGLAVQADAGWCAAFSPAPPSAAYGVSLGDTLTLLFPGASRLPAVRAIAADSQRSCAAQIPQRRWSEYRAFRLQLLDAIPQSSGGSPPLGLAVAGTARWSWTDAGQLRADLDGDGIAEEARQCAAGEGEHLTLWRRDTAAGTWQRVAHEYFDWGVLVDATCAPGEAGEPPET